MKLKAITTTLGISLCSMALATNASDSIQPGDGVEDLFGSPFDHCFADTYNIAEISAEQAHATAECFTSLLNQDDGSLGANKLTVMQYSASWYQVAADKGYQGAQDSLMSNLTALTLLEEQARHGFEYESPRMLASEQHFMRLDQDNNGMLSLAEASGSAELKAKFSHTDFDRDGMLSYGEYSIVSGEATAAGNK